MSTDYRAVAIVKESVGKCGPKAVNGWDDGSADSPLILPPSAPRALSTHRESIAWLAGSGMINREEVTSTKTRSK